MDSARNMSHVKTLGKIFGNESNWAYLDRNSDGYSATVSCPLLIKAGGFGTTMSKDARFP